MIASVSQEAELELIDAARYYAERAGKDLGLALIEEFESALHLLCGQPQLGAPWRDRRRLPLRRFPFSIIYYTSGESLRVIALAHHRRKPGYWFRTHIAGLRIFIDYPGSAQNSLNEHPAPTT